MSVTTPRPEITYIFTFTGPFPRWVPLTNEHNKISFKAAYHQICGVFQQINRFSPAVGNGSRRPVGLQEAILKCIGMSDMRDTGIFDMGNNNVSQSQSKYIISRFSNF